MRLRNGDHGYGAITKTLHWLTVLTIGGQFAVGYTMETDRDFREAECDPAGEDRSGGDTADAEEERLDRLEDRCEAEQDRLDDEADHAVETAWSDLWSGDLFGEGLSLPETHVLLGLTIIALGVLRLVWRRTTALRPGTRACRRRTSASCTGRRSLSSPFSSWSRRPGSCWWWAVTTWSSCTSLRMSPSSLHSRLT